LQLVLKEEGGKITPEARAFAFPLAIDKELIAKLRILSTGAQERGLPISEGEKRGVIDLFVGSAG
jgi:hypothetical protein